MDENLRIIIADDHPLFRDGVVQALEKETGIEVVGHVNDGSEALRMARDLLPDAILLDIAMPIKDGISTAAAISIACPATKIIILTVSEHEDDLMAAFKAGATGYVLKGISGRELGKVVKSVTDGDVYVSPKLASGMLLEMSRPKPHDPLEELTDREQEILQLVAQGLTNREIGQQLHLSEKTIKHYMTNVLQKLQVHSRVQAALLAQKQNLEKKWKSHED